LFVGENFQKCRKPPENIILPKSHLPPTGVKLPVLGPFLERSIQDEAFPLKERQVLELLKARVSIKEIGGLLEISVRTVRDRLSKSCGRARVVDETEMMLFLFQNPHILEKGATCAAGLHIPVMRHAADSDAQEAEYPCSCGNPGCLGPVAMFLKTANGD
jgi:DNA-binding CsgD family transcriptional regulator